MGPKLFHFLGSIHFFKFQKINTENRKPPKIRNLNFTVVPLFPQNFTERNFTGEPRPLLRSIVYGTGFMFFFNVNLRFKDNQHFENYRVLYLT